MVGTLTYVSEDVIEKKFRSFFRVSFFFIKKETQFKIRFFFVLHCGWVLRGIFRGETMQQRESPNGMSSDRYRQAPKVFRNFKQNSTSVSEDSNLEKNSKFFRMSFFFIKKKQ